jgi:hypothetical protein
MFCIIIKGKDFKGLVALFFGVTVWVQTGFRVGIDLKEQTRVQGRCRDRTAMLLETLPAGPAVKPFQATTMVVVIVQDSKKCSSRKGQATTRQRVILDGVIWLGMSATENSVVIFAVSWGALLYMQGIGMVLVEDSES